MKMLGADGSQEIPRTFLLSSSLLFVSAITCGKLCTHSLDEHMYWLRSMQ